MLLAGGRSVRMGRDKALLDCEGQPLWLMQARKLQALQPERLFIACREEQGLHEAAPVDLKIKWLFDPPGSDVGPMGPVLALLDQVQNPLLVLAVDMPNMTTCFLEEAVALTTPENGLFFTAADGIEPLAGLYVPSMLPLLQGAFEAGQYSLRQVLRQAQNQGLAEILPVSEMDNTLFANANTPEEWQQTGK
ncbi:molybdenum cofactor guanylyltransferase [Prosthecobacter sp. SYSU 5D2]|uniref:molybdenum cofactor guanylyltransferase n=1 Tax=Prosthecobacter sp. SYSU 5D2 TaxID=3134134 RepID=UPI0031FE68D6